MTRLIAALLHKICCGRETYIMWVWLVMGVPGVMVCSGVGGVCLLVGWLFKVHVLIAKSTFWYFYHRPLRSGLVVYYIYDLYHMQASADGQVGLLPVIVCVEVLTVPALGSWVKGLRCSLACHVWQCTVLLEHQTYAQKSKINPCQNVIVRSLKGQFMIWLIRKDFSSTKYSSKR